MLHFPSDFGIESARYASGFQCLMPLALGLILKTRYITLGLLGTQRNTLAPTKFGRFVRKSD